MTITDIADDPRPVPVPPDYPAFEPHFEPPPDEWSFDPSSFDPSSFHPSFFGAATVDPSSGSSSGSSFEPPPEWESMPDPRTLSPHVRRQLLLGRFLDDAEVADRQLAVSAAR
ncbi:hypothetical protein ABIE21_003581, partial [Conyzicola nivalis]